MKLSRGLAALILIVFSHLTLYAEYLYKDEVVKNPKFTHEVELLGSELYEKTGVSLRLIMIRDLPNQQGIIEYERELLKEFSEPTVLLVFAELNGQVDIVANDSSLYKHFNKNQILSPVASTAQALAISLFFAHEFDDLETLIKNSGGTILPILGDRTKKGATVKKYSAAMYNGYLDLGEQIATSYNKKLSMDSGKGSENVLFIVKFIFYTIVFLSLIIYIRNKFLRKRKANEV